MSFDPSRTSHSMKYRSDIDGLRSIAVLSVVAYHYSIAIPHYGIMIAPGGFVGVDVFFVISGYLITRIIYGDISQGTHSVAAFYTRRMRRIFPAMFTVFGFVICAALLIDFPSEITEVGRSVAASIYFISNIVFYNSAGYFDQKMEMNPLLHTWSLSIEEQFYLLFPLLVFALRRYSHTARIKFVLAIGLASLAYSAWEVRVDQAAAFYLVQSRAWELLLGSLFAIGGFSNPSARWQGELLAAFGLGLIAVSVELISTETAFPGLAALGPCIGAAAILHSGATTTTWTGRLLASPPLRFVGLISYSLYLWHWPLIVFFRVFREPSNVERVALVVVCILVATISWRFVERPFRERPHRLSTYGTLAGGGGLMAAASVVAIIVGPASASFWNLPRRVDEILAYQNYDAAHSMRDGTCFLTSGSDDFAIYDKNTCLALKPGQKTFLVVGDSHAAHLWPGLQAVFQNVNFLQATASGCKPVVGSSGARRCTALIQFIFDKFLPHNHLDGIILSARWEKLDLAKVRETTEALRPYADKIFVFGPIVEYDRPLPRILALGLGSNEFEFAAKYRRSEQGETDQAFAAALSNDPAVYLSVYRALCSPQCVVWAKKDVPLQFDYGHLTREGSMYLAARLGPDLFPTQDIGR